MPVIVLSTFMRQLFLMIVLGGRYFSYPHFTNVEPENQANYKHGWDSNLGLFFSKFFTLWPLYMGLNVSKSTYKHFIYTYMYLDV